MNFKQHEIATFVGTKPGHRLEGTHVQVLEVGPFDTGHEVYGFRLTERTDYLVMTTEREIAFCDETALEKIPAEAMEKFREHEGLPS